MKFFAPKHSWYIEVSTPTIIFIILSDTFSQTVSQFKMGFSYLKPNK